MCISSRKGCEERQKVSILSPSDKVVDIDTTWIAFTHLIGALLQRLLFLPTEARMKHLALHMQYPVISQFSPGKREP